MEIVRSSVRRDTDKQLGNKEVTSEKELKKVRAGFKDIKNREGTRNFQVDNREGDRRQARGGSWGRNDGFLSGSGRGNGGFSERKCCYSWTETNCLFERKPWGWQWTRRDFRRAKRRSNRPWLRLGDQCYQYENDRRLQNFCYCTNERYRQCVWTPIWQSC